MEYRTRHVAANRVPASTARCSSNMTSTSPGMLRPAITEIATTSTPSPRFAAVTGIRRVTVLPTVACSASSELTTCSTAVFQRVNRSRIFSAGVTSAQTNHIPATAIAINPVSRRLRICVTICVRFSRKSGHVHRGNKNGFRSGFPGERSASVIDCNSAS